MIRTFLIGATLAFGTSVAAHAQLGPTAQKCTIAGQCSGFGPPVGICAPGPVYTDVSQTPATQYACSNTAWVAVGGSGGGGGTVTSFTLTNASPNPFFSTSVANGTTTPNATIALVQQAANCFFAGPSSGGAANPTCRAITVADIPGGTGGPAHAVAPDAEYAFAAGNTSTATEPDATGQGNTATFSGSGFTRIASGGLQFTAAGYLTTPLTTFKSFAYRACAFGPYQNGALATAPNFSAVWGPSAAGQGTSIVPTNPGSVSNGSYTLSPGTYDSTNSFGTLTTDISAGCHTYVAVADTAWRFYLDGYEMQYSAQVASISNALSSGSYLLGGGIGGAAQYDFKGTLMYAESFGTAVLTPAQVLLETAYINAKAGPDPYTARIGTSRTPTILFQGDSITNGNGLTPYSAQLALTNTYNIVNAGVGSERAQSLAANHKYQWWSYLAPNAGKCYSSFFDGTNDVGTAGQSPATVWASIRRAAVEDAATGCDVLVFTMLDRNGSTALHDALNALIRAGVPTLGPRVHLVDVAAIAALGADGVANGTASTYWTSDGIHPTTAGQGLLAAVVSRSINSLDGSSSTNPDITASNAYVETDANNYIQQTPTAAATHQVSDCTGLTGSTRTIQNNSASFSIAVSSTSGQTIKGGLSIGPLGTATYTAMLTSTTTAGCYWLRTQY